ncbi:MAG: hypothetical protein AAGF12_43995 [Myxococcota bacterium]
MAKSEPNEPQKTASDPDPTSGDGETPEPRNPGANRAKLATFFGWLGGGSLGLVANYGIFLAYGPDYPVTPTTFVAVVAGCFLGMAVSDRLGERALRPLGLGAGILLALAITLATLMLLAPGR